MALGSGATAVTASSPSLPSGELEAAISIAKDIGIPHQIIETEEFHNPHYLQNKGDRCFHCKSELYSQMKSINSHADGTRIVNGTNLDDLGDYRPGLQAALECNVHSPLVECKIDKKMVRAIAKHWSLPIWNKPAGPCLSSRVAYGEEVTKEKLQRIDATERWLRSKGFTSVRVRYHQGDLARVEVDEAELPRLVEPAMRTAMIREFETAGFRFVTLDMRGFRSGSMNSLVTIQKRFHR